MKSIEAEKKEVIRICTEASPAELIMLLDATERLGLAYHFESEIKQKIGEIYNFHQDFDLCTALRFRLLRQHQYQVSCGMSLTRANIYKKELCQLTRWWNKFDLKSKLVYARDRIVECYLWGVAANFEPQHSDVRIAFAKSVKLVTIIDDTYDNYATLAEAELFTQHLERWSMDNIDQLPDFMQIVYRFIMNIYEDYKRDATTQEKSFAVPYFKETVKQLARAYNKEQIWIMENKMPSFEEYMTNSVFTSCIFVMLTEVIPGIKSATKEDADWLLNEPKIVISAAKMGRHLDDLGSHERESREGKLQTVMDCYMKDRKVSKKEALAKFAELVEDEWKNVNTEFATQTCSPKEIVKIILNYARACDETFKNHIDGITTPESNLAPQIVALFVDPIPI